MQELLNHWRVPVSKITITEIFISLIKTFRNVSLSKMLFQGKINCNYLNLIKPKYQIAHLCIKINEIINCFTTYSAFGSIMNTIRTLVFP